MKAMKLPKEVARWLAAAETTAEDTLVFTENKRPVAALVSLRKKVDRESIALSTNTEFLALIERSRKEIRAGKVASLESVERNLRKRRRPRTR